MGCVARKVWFGLAKGMVLRCETIRFALQKVWSCQVRLRKAFVGDAHLKESDAKFGGVETIA